MFKKLQDAFPANKSFFELPIVRNTVWTILGASTLSFIIIVFAEYRTNDLVFDPTHIGFNYVFELFKFPIALTAILIPLLAVYAANHRSEQTKENINLLNSQNSFTNYHRHIELFEKHMAEYKDTSVNFNYRNLHSIVFPRHEDGTPTFLVSKDLLDKLDDELLSFYQTLLSIASADPQVKIDAFVCATKIVRAFSIKFYSSVNLSKGSVVKLDDGNNKAVPLYGDGSLGQLFIALIKLIKLLEHAFSFADLYKPSEIINTFLNVKQELIPANFNHTNMVKAPGSLPTSDLNLILDMPERHAANFSER